MSIDIHPWRMHCTEDLIPSLPLTAACDKGYRSRYMSGPRAFNPNHAVAQNAAMPDCAGWTRSLFCCSVEVLRCSPDSGGGTRKGRLGTKSCRCKCDGT